MACKRIIVISTLVCIISALPTQNDTLKGDFNSQADVDYRLPNSTAPIHYDIKLITDVVDTWTFEGESSIKFKVLDPTSDVILHSSNLEIDKNTTRLIFNNGTTLAPETLNHDNVTEKLTIHFNRILETDVYWLSLNFRGNISDELHGFYKSSYDDDEGEASVAATQFEGTYARYAFPCWDEPALKATFNISIKHHANYTSLSNMPIREKEKIDEVDGKVWTHFEKTPIMSTYLVAYVIGDYGNVSNDDGSITIWSRKKMLPYLKYVHEIAQKATIELEKYTNSTARVPKMDHVAVPYHSAEAMENWGLITYTEKNLVYDESKHPLKRKLTITLTVIHELAHQWFGNVVSPTWWSHLWLNEGFASYFQNLVLEKIFNDWRAMDYFVAIVVQGSLSTDTKWHITSIDFDINTPDEIEAAFSSAAYSKAPSILHMLASIVSPDVFRAGIINYLNEHEYGSTNPDSLWEALQNALNKSDVPRKDINVKEIMDTWIKQKRYPLVTVERDYSTGSMNITQEDYALVDVHKHINPKKYQDELITYQWWVPINFATESSPDFSDTSPTKWLKPNETLTIEGINSDDWIILNKQQTGYYKVNYDDANWKKISDYLGTENFTNIHVLNRAQILNDVTQLVSLGRLKPSVFLEFFNYLKREEDYIAWYPMFNYMETLKHWINFPSSKPIKTLLVDTMEHLMKDVGFEVLPNDEPVTILKRIETLEWMCHLGNVECNQQAAAKMAEYLNDPDGHKLSPDLMEWVFLHGMKLANESVWYKGFELCMRDPSSEVLNALSFTENPALIKVYLNASISNDTNFEEEQQGMMAVHSLDNSPFLDIVLDFFINNWSEIERRSTDIDIVVYSVTSRLHDDEQLNKQKKLCKIMDTDFCKNEKVWKKKQSRLDESKASVQKWISAINDMSKRSKP